MTPGVFLRTAILPYLEKYDFIISDAGVRYGSVAYITFGRGVLQRHSGRAATIKYPVEFEFGSDRWKLIHDARIVADSENYDKDLMRKILSNYLINQKLTDIEVSERDSKIEFGSRTLLISEISPEPASGFLYSFQAENQPAWETVDGVVLKN